MPVELKNVLKVTDPGGFTYFLGVFTPAEIKQLTFVPVVSAGGQDGEQPLRLNEEAGGYQRSGDYKRMTAIKEFVAQRPSCIIPPVLLSAREQWVFNPSSANKAFGTITATALAAVIDGQHRLGGLWQLAKDEALEESLRKRPVPFMAIENMTVEQEMREFVDINDNQKGVKKSLFNYLQREKDFHGMAALALMEDDESVFKGRISIEDRKDWDLVTFGAMKECVQLMFGRELQAGRKIVLTDKAVQEAMIEVTLRYWKTVKESLPEFWADVDLMPPPNTKRDKSTYPGRNAFNYRLLEETGIRAFSLLASEMFNWSWVEGVKAPSFDAIATALPKMAGREDVRLALTKPSKDSRVLQLDPGLKSTGKAGADAIYTFLKTGFFSSK